MRAGNVETKKGTLAVVLPRIPYPRCLLNPSFPSWVYSDLCQQITGRGLSRSIWEAEAYSQAREQIFQRRCLGLCPPLQKAGTLVK